MASKDGRISWQSVKARNEDDDTSAGAFSQDEEQVSESYNYEEPSNQDSSKLHPQWPTSVAMSSDQEEEDAPRSTPTAATRRSRRKSNKRPASPSSDTEESPSSTSSRSFKQRRQDHQAFLQNPHTNLQYSWDALGLGVRVGSAALNQTVREHQNRSLQLTSLQTLQLVHSLKLTTIVPPEQSPLHQVIQNSRAENREVYRLDQDSDDDADKDGENGITNDSPDKNAVDESPVPSPDAHTADKQGATTSNPSESGDKNKDHGPTSPTKTVNATTPETPTIKNTSKPQESSPNVTTGDETNEPSATAQPPTNDNDALSSASIIEPPPPLPRFKTFARLYQNMCEQDADGGWTNRREMQFLQSRQVVDKLYQVENAACSLKRKEDAILARARELNVVNNTEIAKLMGYWTPLERYNRQQHAQK